MGTGLGQLIGHPPLKPLRARIKQALIASSDRTLGRQATQGRIGPDIRYNLAIPGLTGPCLLTRNRVTVSGWVLDLARGCPLPWRARIGGRLLPAEPVERADVAAAFAPLAELPLRCGGTLGTRLRPGPHLLRVEAETQPGRWAPVFRCLVLCLDTDFGTFDPWDISDYPGWREREARVQAADAASQRAYAAMVGFRPSVTAIVEGGAGAARDGTLRSLEAQTFEAWTAILVGPDPSGSGHDVAPNLAAALARATGDYVLPLKAGDRLTPDALYHLAAAAQADPGLDLLYADEEGDTGGSDPLPFFKPAWSPDTLESFDYLGAPALFRASLVRNIPAEAAYDLALRFTETTGRVRHVRKVLCHRPHAFPKPRPEDEAQDFRALMGRLQRTGRAGSVNSIGNGQACYRLDLSLSASPLVSIVIPSAGRNLEVAGRRRDLVVECVRDIRERSTYRNVEIVVVVNPDLAPEKAEALAALGCRTRLYDDPDFNVARKLNLGAERATGEYLLLLNDDVEVIAPDWIERLLAQALKPHVGVVGGKLLYPDGTVQHAGVVTLHGNPNHVRRGFPDADLGYAFSSVAPRNYGAVTGACMMTRTEVYRQVGGYEEAFPIHFNDVDFCFKVRRLGLHIVYEPACRLYHFESASRRPGIHPDELALFQSRWPSETLDDPFYANHAFGTAPPNFEIFMRTPRTPRAGRPRARGPT
ncbi:glycosyltransferase [uncultured Enterovirga sp.]|uniref:glycosyltransferase family 2 protein n=1 Tax=uncultured Enterovirga sp. TaxID=2026352 RepID=UPI0035CB08E0